MEWVRTKSSDCDIIFCVSGQSCYTIMTHVGADASCESLATCCTDNFIQVFVTFSTNFLPVKLDIDLPVKGSFAQCPSSNLTHQLLSMWKLIAFSFHSAEVCKSH